MLSDGLLALEQGYDSAVVDALFRAAHSMKGMAGTLGFMAEAELAHALEDHLSHMRAGGTAPVETVSLLVDATDVLVAAVDAIAGTHTGPDLAAVTERLRAQRTHDPRAGHDGATALRERPPTNRIPDDVHMAARRLPAGRGLCLKVQLRDTCLAPKARLMVLERTLTAAGTVAHLHPSREAWDELNPAEGVTIYAALQDVADHEALANRVRRMPEILDAQVIDVEAEGASAAPPPAADIQAAGSTVRIPVERIDRLLDRAGEVRIALSQLDRLLADHFLGERPYALTEGMIRLEREAKDLHDDALALRTLPVSVITRRFTRLVRDTAKALGKDVTLVIEGEGTEVDRSVLESLADPVMHLVKNAVGHGIEAPAERKAAGKDPTATVAIRFTRVPTGVEVIVSDDGAGIDRDRVVARAIEAGHIEPGTMPESLSDKQVFALLTRPGFSTAAAVTDVSGRGVGLDVVQERLNAIGGSINLQSTRGRGTEVRLTLPPTLALVEALECLIDGDPYYVPVDTIVTTLRLARGTSPERSVTYRDTRAENKPSADRAHIDDDASIDMEPVDEVHRTVRLIDLDTVLGIRARRLPYAAAAPALTHATGTASRSADGPSPTAAEAASDRSRYGIIVEKHGHLAGLAVDAFGTIQELVVKAVDLQGPGPRYISGAAIRPDGRVGLLLDIPSLLGAGLAARNPSAVTP